MRKSRWPSWAPPVPNKSLMVAACGHKATLNLNALVPSLPLFAAQRSNVLPPSIAVERVVPDLSTPQAEASPEKRRVS